MDYTQTIEYLRSQGLIAPDDIVVVGQEPASTESFVLFGAIGAAISAADKGHHILSASERGIRIFDIDRETGAFLGSWGDYPVERLRYAKFSMNGAVAFGDSATECRFWAKKKFKGYAQKEQFVAMKKLFKETFRNLPNAK